MANEVRLIESRPWGPQDLIDDLQLMIDEEPDNYLNGNRATLCMARDYLKKFFAAETLRPKGRWELMGEDDYKCSVCGFRFTSGDPIEMFPYCRCGCKMEGDDDGK